MDVVAAGVIAEQQTIAVATWLHGAGRVLGTFPNTSAGIDQCMARLVVLGVEYQARGVHLAFVPCGGAELLFVQAASAHDWPLTVVDPTRFAVWAADVGYTIRTGTAGALAYARYAATFPPPVRHDPSPSLDALDTLLAQHHDPSATEDLFKAYPILPYQAQQLQRYAGINADNLLPLLALLQRWQPRAGSGGIQLDTQHRTGPVAWLRSIHPAAWIAIAIVVLLRFVRLDTLPGDLYGDIAIVISYVTDIFEGQWPTAFDLSAGPLYHYLITPLLWLTGLTYYGVKLASVLTSLLTLAATYLLARDLVDDEFALFAFFWTGVSCWLLIFSRLGNSQILVPLLAVGSVALAVRGVRRRRQRLLVAAALVAAGGLYTYPQSFIIPGVTGLIVCWLVWQEPRRPWRDLLLYGAVSILGALPFVAIAYRDLAAFLTGYVGDKLPNATQWSAVLHDNLWSTLLAFHVRGDRTFRSNPQDLPQLDEVSGVLFVIGFVFWVLPKQRRLAPVVFVPFLLLQVPALLVRYTIEVPSASRTLGIVPFVGLLVAGGLRSVVDVLRRWPAMCRTLMYTVAAVVLLLNGYRYFVVYADGLPNHNLAFGREISRYIDSLPPERAVLVVGCCWGEMGQPHPFAITYDVAVPRQLTLVPTNDVRCDQIAMLPRPATLIWGLIDGPPAPQLAPCLTNLVPVLHRAASGEPVFFSADLPP